MPHRQRKQASTGNIPLASRAKALNRMQQGTYTADGEGIDWRYYDTVTIPSTSQTLNMFTVAQGGNKTLADTNMTLNGQIPNGQHFTITDIRITYRSTTGLVSLAEMNEMNAFLDTSVFEFTILNKYPMLQTKVSDIIGMGLIAPVVVAAGNADNSQMGLFTATFKLKTPITVAGLTSFKCPITLTAAPAASVVGDSMTVYLGGRLVRSL